MIVFAVFLFFVVNSIIDINDDDIIHFENVEGAIYEYEVLFILIYMLLLRRIFLLCNRYWHDL